MAGWGDVYEKEGKGESEHLRWELGNESLKAWKPTSQA